MNQAKMRHLSTGNTRGFFRGMKVGELFTARAKTFGEFDVKRKAKTAGVVIQSENAYGDNIVYRVQGMIAELPFDQPKKKAASPTEAGKAAFELLRLKLNISTHEVCDRAAWLIRHLLNGDLSMHFAKESARMGDTDFAYYYGHTATRIIMLAEALENITLHGKPKNDPMLSAETVMAQACFNVDPAGCAALQWNWSHLVAAGIPHDIKDFASDFRGMIQKVEKLDFSNGEVVIIVSRERDNERKPKYYVSGDGSYCYSTMESAVFHAMFGMSIAPAIQILYDKANEQRL